MKIIYNLLKKKQVYSPVMHGADLFERLQKTYPIGAEIETNVDSASLDYIDKLVQEQQARLDGAIEHLKSWTQAEIKKAVDRIDARY